MAKRKEHIKSEEEIAEEELTDRTPELTELPCVGAVREHLLKQAGYTTVEIVASKSVEDIQKAININYDTARRIFERAIRLTGAKEYKKITGTGISDDECLEVALKELEEQGLIRDVCGDNWKATERGIIEHKKLMVLLSLRK